mmetsp:Transcript_22625/g.28546  ORF Transcript_22625/g.28546 Transcript_22625/m.28546 type:complete len:217 (-) Transcript_22625:276-926(-)|eukprot:CAMPEP_0203658348 /NCGR_PEP_ID=MMETSP0088-20131115/48036_1 /ASSEMBLY_ACC=CAM_ASM_001087 /TAXON_ID=426623 /ORGANISM="Chaetoceros affinis, Strain CCMP159" /LENGTH=216 /DNA_ID=CAMNT_0050519993 /DNA_START=20 /DNA_END=670 /DNA_ORIENTATION=-
MLRIKKQKEDQKKAAAAEAATADNATAATNATQSNKPKVSLLGVGGKKKKDGANGKEGKKRTAGEIRIQKDITELDAGKAAKVTFPNPNDLTKFNVSVTPDSGFWKDATYNFVFAIPAHYPHEPPKVTCETKIYHPNINLEGNVCLNILREDWKPVLDINSVIYGLIYLFYEPNPDDPLNHDAAEVFRNDKKRFEKYVQRSLYGGSVDGTYFPKLL